MMHPYLMIELPDETVAEELRRHLQSFDVDAVEAETHWELRIQLVERNPEIRIKSALRAIDSWLPEAGVESVRVHLDGRSYTLHAEPEEIAAGAS
jgi:uncharacterized protein with PIN domain